MNNIADHYYHLGDYNKAVEYATKAMDVRKATLGEKHPDYATSLNNLACYYSDLCNGMDKHEALQMAQKSLREYKDEKGQTKYDQPLFWARFIILD